MDKGPQFVYHGTDEDNAENIMDNGVRTGISGGIQVHGPGFYVTSEPEVAESYARDRNNPHILRMGIQPRKSISLTPQQLATAGKHFRTKSGRSLENFTNAALGNISLRKKGYDYLDLKKGDAGVGVVLRKSAVDPEIEGGPLGRVYYG